MQTYIFDLDHTVIDSTHRQLTKADGSLDLAHWIENNTPEKIAADKLLPLADTMRQRIAQGREVIICTARVMGEHDYQFLKDHGLFVPVILSRPMGDSSPDWMLKERLLRQYASDTGRSWARFCLSAVMYDDNESVVKMAYLNNIDAYNAIALNKIMAA
jgi:hypothetical protein